MAEKSSEPWRGAGTRWLVLREVGLILAGVVVYFVVRGIFAGRRDEALRNAEQIVDFERRLGLYHEPMVQNLVEGSDWRTSAANWIYIWGHWPVITVTLLWLVIRHPAVYRVTRNTMLASGLVGLVVFIAYPLAPPRLAPLGLTDTVSEQSQAYRVLQPKAFVNQYAAMPSLHVGWDLLIGLALVTCARRRILRTAGVLLPLLMIVSVIATANHYFVDAVAGIALVLACRAVALRVEARGGIRRARDDPGEDIRAEWADAPSPSRS